MSSSDPLSSLWQAAVQKYEKDHDYPLSTSSRGLSPEEVLEDKCFQFKTARSKHKNLISAFEPFYHTLRSVCQVIGHGLKLVYPPAEAITSAILVFIDVVQRTSQNYDAIADMLDDLRYLLERYRGYTASTVPTQLKYLVVDGLVHTLHIISLSTKAAEQGRFRTFLKTLIHKEKSILEAMRKLDKLSIREGHTVSAASFSATSEILKISEDSFKLNLDHSHTVHSILSKIVEIASHCTDLHTQSQLHRALLEELQTLATPVSEVNRKQQLKKLKRSTVFSAEHDTCLEGTRNDILEAIQNWVDDRNAPNIFWLYGHPGTGKSTIATTVRHNLARDRQLGAACFFRREDAALHNPKAVWCSMAHDLGDKHGFLTPSIIKRLEQNHIDVEDSSPFDVYRVLISDALQQSTDGFNDCLVIIVDALDEFGGLDPLNQPQRDLLQTLVPNWKKLPSCFKLLITSRDQGYIGSYLHANSSECVALRVGEHAKAQSSADIRIFLKVKFADIASRPLRFGQPGLMISETDINDLAKAAAGLFIWASTVIRMVAKRPTMLQVVLSRVRNTVNGSMALNDLGRLYDVILEWAYNDFGDDDAVRLFIGAIITSRIPLSCHTLGMLLNVETDDIKIIAGNLQPVLDDSSSTLHFVHKSFVDYLISKSCPNRFRCDMRIQDQLMSLACFSTMAHGLHFNMGSMQSSHLLNKDYPEMSAMISAHLAYACRFWATHIPNGPLELSLEEAAAMFLDRYLLSWLEVLSILGCFGEASTSMALLLSRLKDISHPDITKARDALSFILAFAPCMSQSYPHIYLSALAFTPPCSVIRKKYIKSSPLLLKVSHGLKTWPRQLGILRGHESAVISVSFSPVGTRIASGSYDQNIRLWDAEMHFPVGKPLQGHEDEVTSVAFSPDGNHIVSGSRDCTIRIWNVETHRQIGEPLRGHGSAVTSVSFSSEGNCIASGSWDHTIRIWNVEAQRQIGGPLQGHYSVVTSVSFSSDGNCIASGSWDGTVRIWDVASQSQIGEPLRGHYSVVTSVSFSPNGNCIVSGSSDCKIRIWDVESQCQIGKPFLGPRSTVTSVAFSSDGNSILSGFEDSTICIWDVETHRQIGEPLRGHGSAVTSVTFSSDGTRIASSSKDGTIRLWDAELKQPSVEPNTLRITSIAESADRTRIVSGTKKGTIRLSDAETQRPIGNPLRGHKKMVTSIAFSSDGAYIVSGSEDGTICLWDAETQSPLCKPFRGYKDKLTSLPLFSDVKWIVSVTLDKILEVQDIGRRNPVDKSSQSQDNSVTLLAFSPDGTRIVSATLNHTLRVWDVGTQHSIGEPFGDHKSLVTSVTFSPDGTRIISGSEDSICIWDAKTQCQIGKHFRPSKKLATSLTFSANGTCIIRDSENNPIRLVDETPLKLTPRSTTILPSLKAMIPPIGSGFTSPPSLLHDGWVVGPSKEYLFWVPPLLHDSIETLGLLAIMGRPITTIDYSKFVHGESWDQCCSRPDAMLPHN